MNNSPTQESSIKLSAQNWDEAYTLLSTQTISNEMKKWKHRWN